ncbi:MAG: septum formation protein Maf [Alphaproteobacteria bacterium]|nr:septum formation protein Maf [Alphaproteobacteria bacterium]
MKNRLILASASPRRLDLLARIGVVPAEIIPPAIDESPLRGELPRALALRLSIQKAQEIAAQNPGSYILAADTVVACGRRILPKTEDEQSAQTCLDLLSGRRHYVWGGITLITPTGKIISRACETLVQFRRLEPADIAHYIALREWQGKAGGYAIQGYAETFVKFFHGSHSNVVGLSLYDTMIMLRSAGFKIGG